MKSLPSSCSWPARGAPRWKDRTTGGGQWAGNQGSRSKVCARRRDWALCKVRALAWQRLVSLMMLNQPGSLDCPMTDWLIDLCKLWPLSCQSLPGWMWSKCQRTAANSCRHDWWRTGATGAQKRSCNEEYLDGTDEDCIPFTTKIEAI